MELVAIVLLIAVVAVVVALPLRSNATADRADDERRAALEAAKEAKYREIRDAEMDLRMGKLGPEDHRDIDRGLRAEAIEILRRLDELGPEEAAPPGEPKGGGR